MRGRRSSRAQQGKPGAELGAPVRFVHLIEFQTSRIDEVMPVLRRWHESELAGERGVSAAISKDCDRHNRYVWMLGLSSARDSIGPDLAALERLNRQLGPYIDGHIVLRNLDIIDDGSRTFDEPGDSTPAREVNAR